ncbi:MAG TPA: PAS domain S-box protein, partial [Methanocella sp.]|nr:PAS domain S-box protein [Methanocella sp.]
PESIVITDVAGNIEYVNPKFTEVTGYRFEEVLGQNPCILSSGKTPKAVIKELWETIMAGRDWRGELVNRKKNGDLYWESASISPVSDSVGQITHFVAVKQDITDQKRTAEALEKYRLFSDYTRDIFLFVTPDGKIIEANAAAVEAYGYTRQELLSMHIYDLRAGDPADRVKMQMESALDRGILFEAVHHRKDGTTFPVEVSSRGGLINGRPVLLSVIRDITERKQAENALSESEEKFRLTFDQSPIGAAISSPDFMFLKVNGEFCRITGYPEHELLSLTFPEITYPADVDGNVELARKLAAGEIPMYELEKRYVKKDGEIIWVRLTTRIVRDSGLAPLYYLSLIQDITIRKRAEEAINAKNRELELFNSIATTLNSAVEFPDKLRQVLHLSLELAGLDAGAIYLAEDDRPAEMYLVAAEARTESGRTVKYQQIEHYNEPVEQADAPHYIQQSQDGTLDRGRQTCLIPLSVNGQPLGVMSLCCCDGAERHESLQVLAAICSQVGIAIENHRLFKKVQDTNRYLADVINDSPDPILTTDARGTILSFNRRAADLLKYDPAAVIGNNVSLLLNGQQIDYSDTGSHVMDFVCRDKTTVTLSVSTSRLHREGTLPGHIITLKDLSAITGFKVVPVAENAAETDQLYHFEKGYIYLFETGQYHDFMNAFTDQVNHNIQGLCITRKNPGKLRERYGLEKTPVVWLTGNEGVLGEICLKPDNLSGLSATVNKFIGEAKDGLILLDGLEYLMARNNYESLLKFVHFLNDRIMLNKCRVICCADFAAFEERQLHLLTTEMKMFGEADDTL